MKIALIGYGKMGKAIEKIALQNGHEIVLKITQENAHTITEQNLKKCDVAIEFTNPHSAIKNMQLCIAAGVPVVCGSTGWQAQQQQMVDYCAQHNGALLYASNFSIGVNIFFEINKKLAALMQTQVAYKVSIEEVHHTQKKDAPSGTAITLADQILACRSDFKKWELSNEALPNSLAIKSVRTDPTPGTHTIMYQSAIDDISITHTAHNRDGFAQGALYAAQYLIGKNGLFSMADVLKSIL